MSRGRVSRQRNSRADYFHDADLMKDAAPFQLLALPSRSRAFWPWCQLTSAFPALTIRSSSAQGQWRDCPSRVYFLEAPDRLSFSKLLGHNWPRGFFLKSSTQEEWDFPGRLSLSRTQPAKGLAPASVEAQSHFEGGSSQQDQSFASKVEKNSEYPMSVPGWVLREADPGTEFRGLGVF